MIIHCDILTILTIFYIENHERREQAKMLKRSVDKSLYEGNNLEQNINNRYLFNQSIMPVFFVYFHEYIKKLLAL